MRKKIITILTLLLGLILVYSPFAFVWQVQAAGTISGRVFQDFNGNGTYDTTLTIPNSSGSGTIGVAIDRGIANVTVWANSTVFKAGDAADLTNERLSVYLLMTCLNGYTNQPNGESLAEALIKAGNGAIAVWTSSGITHSEKQFEISQAFTKLVYKRAGTTSRIGDVVKAAKAATTDSDVRRTWQLVGDPTVFIR